MVSWLCFPCKQAGDDSHEEVRIEPTSVVDTESRDDSLGGNPQSSMKTMAGDLVGVASEGLTVPVGQACATEPGLSQGLSVRSAMPPGARTPCPENGVSSGIVGFGADSSPVAGGENPDEIVGSMTPVASSMLGEAEIIRREEEVIEKLKGAQDNVRIWLRESLILWRKLPVGDDCDGEAFLEAASTIPAVYPWVFCVKYAVTYLSKDYHDHISTVRKTWPKGARTMREAVRMEVKAEGSDDKIGRKYWKTCSVRLLWICRTMRMFDVIMEVLATSDETPVVCGRTALDRILTPYLSWTLKKIAEYIIGVCCWKTQGLFYEQVKVPPAEFKECVGLLYPLIRNHADNLEKMLEAELPSTFAKRC